MIMIGGFTVLIWLSVRVYHDAPPIPARVVSATGETIFTQTDILAGQRLFLQYGLMENGSIWGHGAYLGPDFSAAYLWPGPGRRHPRHAYLLPGEEVVLTLQEQQAYDQLATYCRGLAVQLSARGGTRQQSAVGFLLSFLRLRFASSLYAIRETLRRRLHRVEEALSSLGIDQGGRPGGH